MKTLQQILSWNKVEQGLALGLRWELDDSVEKSFMETALRFKLMSFLCFLTPTNAAEVFMRKEIFIQTEHSNGFQACREALESYCVTLIQRRRSEVYPMGLHF